MDKKKLSQFMTDKRSGKPSFVSEINGRFIIAVYQGKFSKYDILIRYRQKEDDSWSRIRTPKHIHWAVDILIKMHAEREKTKDFLNFLINVWDNTKPIKSKGEREKLLSIENLLEINKKEIDEYEKLSEKGEYSIKFLILLAKLLMIQEKTNLERAYMFKNLLNALKSARDIFKIVSIATHNRR